MFAVFNGVLIILLYDTILHVVDILDSVRYKHSQKTKIQSSFEHYYSEEGKEMITQFLRYVFYCRLSIKETREVCYSVDVKEVRRKNNSYPT